MNNTNFSDLSPIVAMILGGLFYAFLFFGLTGEGTNTLISSQQPTTEKVSLFSYNQSEKDGGFVTVDNSTNSLGIALPSREITIENDGEISNEEIVTSEVDEVMGAVGFQSSSPLRSMSNNSRLAQNYSFETMQNLLISNSQTQSDGAVQPGSKRAVKALAGKTASGSISSNKGAKKVDGEGGAGDPGVGSLPVGNGVWVMLIFAAVYTGFRRKLTVV